VERRKSFRDARDSAKNLIAQGKGLPNRPAGAFVVPTEGMSEPARTERLLSAPFTLCHQVPGDAFQAREGFQLFRVNALSCVGYYWRFVVLCVNVTVGILGGLSPLIAPRGPTSTEAIAQVSTLLGVQLSMAMVCYCVRPDADKIFSYFAGTQFLMEAAGTACRLWSVLQPDVQLLGDTISLAFTIALIAIFIPMTQMVESKLLKPCVQSLRKHNCDPVQILGIVIMLLLTLPKNIRAIWAMLTGQSASSNDGVDEEKAVAGASALLIKTMVGGKDLKRVETKTKAKRTNSDDDDDGGVVKRTNSDDDDDGGGDGGDGGGGDGDGGDGGGGDGDGGDGGGDDGGGDGGDD